MPSYLVGVLGSPFKNGTGERDETQIVVSGFNYVEYAPDETEAVRSVAGEHPGRYVALEVESRSVTTVVVEG